MKNTSKREKPGQAVIGWRRVDSQDRKQHRGEQQRAQDDAHEDSGVLTCSPKRFWDPFWCDPVPLESFSSGS